MIALGLMSGTSVDAIDLALVETDGETIARLGHVAEQVIAPLTRAAVRTASAAVRTWHQGDPVPAVVLEAERLMTEAHETAIAAFIAAHGPPEVIGFHGQTILHRPDDRLTWQIGDAQALANRFHLDVVAHFREADVAAGGQGAPLAPLYHQALARTQALVQTQTLAQTQCLDQLQALDQTLGGAPLVVLNLGGVGNVTWIGEVGEDPVAFDTGPANALIDDWALTHTGRPMDEGGRLAALGTVDLAVLATLLNHPYFAKPPPKSLDRDEFDEFSALPVAGLTAADGAATLTAFTIESVALAVRHMPRPPGRILVTGGGRRNPVLMAGLARRLGVPTTPIEAVGWRGDALEAEAFAYLAVRSLAGLCLSLPTTTGVRVPCLGGQLFRPKRSSR